MNRSSHSPVWISPQAKIAGDAIIGPGAVIEAGVEIGPGCVIDAHAVIRSGVRMGRKNRVHPFCVLGGEPQDLKFRGEPSELIIGDGNTFRESVTVNRGTAHGGGVTRIGAGNLFMAYVHIAHDCVIGDGCIFANGATLAGHVMVGDQAAFGGFAAVGPFARIGRGAFVAAGAMVPADVPPCVRAAGDRARLLGLNAQGCRKLGWSGGAMGAYRQALRILFSTHGSRERHLAEIRESLARQHPETAELLEFVAGGKMGLCSWRKNPGAVHPGDDE
ncbi:MAG: Acyl-[acyl-carrier-protein]--UDP-N-acetylglucosamine O-acyltransferase [Myxococcota bacterium]|nr:Acyl-[acyl-carrier-protein]--UDP-N-acetylglucosamine O-acyltransferase [Myxococcota bacterium]